MKIKGKALQLRVNNKTIALSTSCSLNTTTQVTDSKTKDDANGPAGEFDFVDWNASSENVVGANENVTNEMVYAELMELQLAGTVIDLSCELMANALGKIPQGGWTPDTATNKAFAAYGGKALIESVNLSAPADGNATVSVNFKAVGPLGKVSEQTSQTAEE